MSVEYRTGDALEALRDEADDSARFVHLDDAWARPKRCGGFGVEYPTHPFSRDDDHANDPDLTVREIVEECLRVTATDGVIAIDVDDWLLSRLSAWLAEEIGPDQYAVGNVVETTKAGDPDRSTPGMYLSNGGYSVVFAMPGACPASIPASVVTDRQRESYGWGSAKPLDPYRRWIRAMTCPGDRVLVPCAGTAPAAIAAELEHGDRANVLAVDIEQEAKEAYQRRREAELDRQTELSSSGEA